MKSTKLELTRIALRYLAGALVAKGIVSAETAAMANDPAFIEIAVGVVTAIATEIGFAIAKMRTK